MQLAVGTGTTNMEDRVRFLEQALDHIINTCRGSRTRTNRLAWIEQRAQEAIDGIPYDREKFVPVKLNQKSAGDYEGEIRRLEAIIDKYREELDYRGIWID